MKYQFRMTCFKFGACYTQCLQTKPYKHVISTHRYTESPAEAYGLAVFFNNLWRLRGDGTVDNVGRVLQERLCLTAFLITLTHKHT